MQNKILQVLFRLCFALSIPLATIIHISLNKARPGVHIVKTFVDDLIPFNRYFALPYLFMFLFISISLLYFAIVDSKTYFRLLASVVCGMLLCFVVYYLFPTTVPRPKLLGNDFFSNLVKDIYASDNPYNCFPSIHVLSAYLPILFAFKYNKSIFMKGFTFIGGGMIILSTLFIKQHYVLDGVASIVIGTLLYSVFTNEIIWNRLPLKAIAEFSVAPDLKTDL